MCAQYTQLIISYTHRALASPSAGAHLRPNTHSHTHTLTHTNAYTEHLRIQVLEYIVGLTHTHTLTHTNAYTEHLRVQVLEHIVSLLGVALNLGHSVIGSGNVGVHVLDSLNLSRQGNIREKVVTMRRACVCVCVYIYYTSEFMCLTASTCQGRGILEKRLSQ
jgi:hypothetical protein